MSIKSVFLFSAALTFALATHAIGQTSSSGSSPATGNPKGAVRGNDVGTNADPGPLETGNGTTGTGTDSFAPGSTGTSGDTYKSGSRATSTTHGRTGTSGKHGGGRDGGGILDGGL